MELERLLRDGTGHASSWRNWVQSLISKLKEVFEEFEIKGTLPESTKENGPPKVVENSPLQVKSKEKSEPTTSKKRSKSTKTHRVANK